jgi:hypothetical protein
VSSAPHDGETGTRTPPGELRTPPGADTRSLGQIEVSVESLELRELRHDVKRMLWFVAFLFVFGLVLCVWSLPIKESDEARAGRHAGVAFGLTAISLIALSSLARYRPLPAAVFAVILFGAVVLWFSLFRKGGPACAEPLIWLGCTIPLVRAVDAGMKHRRLQ